MVKCALVCITKNDKKYLKEFIQYYLKLGFTSIFLFDNSSRKDIKEFHDPPRVHVVWFPGITRQIASYNTFLHRYKRFYDYVAFFDSDEFLVLKKHSSIGEFCQDMIPSGALGINWYMFGNNGQEEYHEDLVLNRFTRRDLTMNKHLKTIAKCSDIHSMVIHNPKILVQGSYRNCRGEEILPVQNPFNHNFDDSMVQLNHYYTKSTQECKEKIERGRSDIIVKRKFEDMIPNMKMNHVEDLWAYRFFHGIPDPDSLVKVVRVRKESDTDTLDRQKHLFSRIYIYSDIIPFMGNQGALVLPDTENHVQHFLTYHKHAHSHVLFLEPSDILDTETLDLLSFCQKEVESGAVVLKSKQNPGQRILGRCRDILEMSSDTYEITKIGYRETIRPTDKIFFKVSE